MNLKPSKQWIRRGAGVFAVVGAGMVLWHLGNQRQPVEKQVAASITAANSNSATAAAVAKSSSPAAPRSGNATFQKRPFSVARQTDNNDWTAEDGRNPRVIRELAHNPLEYDRMLAENDT